MRRVTPLDFDSIRFQSVPFHSLRPSEWCRLFGSHHETCRNVASFRTERLANGSHVAMTSGHGVAVEVSNHVGRRVASVFIDTRAAYR